MLRVNERNQGIILKSIFVTTVKVMVTLLNNALRGLATQIGGKVPS